MYDYGARHYSPSIGRFLSADTIVPQPGNPQSLNRYSYVHNNPLKYTDPTGHNATCAGFAANPVAYAGCTILTDGPQVLQQIESLVVQYGPQVSRLLQQWGANYRANYEQYYGVARDPNYQVHHVLPQQWRDVLSKVNISADDPRWLREIQAVPGDENLHARFFTTRWGEFANNAGT